MRLKIAPPCWQTVGTFAFVACAIAILVDSAPSWGQWLLLGFTFSWALAAVIFPPWREPDLY